MLLKGDMIEVEKVNVSKDIKAEGFVIQNKVG